MKSWIPHSLFIPNPSHLRHIMVTHRPANPKAAGLRPRARPGRKPQKVERTRVDPGRRLLDVGKTTVPQQAM